MLGLVLCVIAVALFAALVFHPEAPFSVILAMPIVAFVYLLYAFMLSVSEVMDKLYSLEYNHYFEEK